MGAAGHPQPGVAHTADEILPDKYKQVVLLYHYQSMTMEEVADALRVSRPAVSRRLKKAYELLRAELEGGAEQQERYIPSVSANPYPSSLTFTQSSPSF